MSQTDVNRPVYKTFMGRQFIHGGGVAIFHVASARVVVVHHTKENHYFLPKGRRDIGEDSVAGAEREGFEETGFRNRVLPLPLPTVQTRPPSHRAAPTSPSTLFHTEPIMTSLFPMGRHGQIQYLASWYIAETLPPALEASLNSAAAAAAAAASQPGQATYLRPDTSPADETLEERVGQEPAGYEPRRQERVVVQSDEVDYFARLMPVAEARERLAGTGLGVVVVEGWRMIQERMRLEREWKEARQTGE